MKSRLIGLSVCLLFVVAALCTGLLHHHHAQGVLVPDSHCAACAWHISSVTGIPLVSIAVPVIRRFAVPLLPAPSLAPVAFLYLPSASRAPPVAST